MCNLSKLHAMISKVRPIFPPLPISNAVFMYSLQILSDCFSIPNQGIRRHHRLSCIGRICQYFQICIPVPFSNCLFPAMQKYSSIALAYPQKRQYVHAQLPYYTYHPFRNESYDRFRIDSQTPLFSQNIDICTRFMRIGIIIPVTAWRVKYTLPSFTCRILGPPISVFGLNQSNFHFWFRHSI